MKAGSAALPAGAGKPEVVISGVQTQFLATLSRHSAALLGLYITLTPAAFSALLIIAGAANKLCLIILAEIYLIAGIVGYCYWWLYRRLICLPDIPQNPPADSGRSYGDRNSHRYPS